MPKRRGVMAQLRPAWLADLDRRKAAEHGCPSDLHLAAIRDLARAVLALVDVIERRRP